MNLLTADIRRQLPRLYATEAVPCAAKLLVAKWFHPATNWTWYAVEGEPDGEGDFTFFGLVEGHDREWGYFSLRQLETAHHGSTGLGRLPVERDIHFRPCLAGELLPGLVIA